MGKFKMLVPLDFGKESEIAMDMALEIGQSHGADIYLFHVHEGRPKSFRDLDRVNEEVMDKMKSMVIAAINRAAAHGNTRTVEEVYRRMSNGKAWSEILKMAGNISADIIVMGYKARGGTWEKVLRKAPCSVVLAREKDPDFVMT